MGWFGPGVLAVVAILLSTLGGGWQAIALILLFLAAIAAINRYEFGRVD
jgi:hypothetical protein